MKKAGILCLSALLIAACASFPKPNQLLAPTPIPGNSGKYMCPYTQDDTVAEWVDTGTAAKAASAIGSTLGREAGSRLLSSVPLVGSIFGGKVGDEAGRAIAVKYCGGWEKIKATSDLSFNNCEDLCVWLYVTKSHREDYKNVLSLAGGIYPELNKKYEKYIKKAYKRQQKG